MLHRQKYIEKYIDASTLNVQCRFFDDIHVVIAKNPKKLKPRVEMPDCGLWFRAFDSFGPC